MKTTVAIAILLAVQPATAADEDWQSWPIADRFKISAGAFFPRIDTSVRLDSSNGIVGTTIDFEQNLNMSETETLPSLGFAWRFAKKHRLRVSAFDLNRSGSSITTSEIRFGNEVFQIDLPISSFFDTRVTTIDYSYSFILDEKKELALSAGLSVQDIQFGLVGEGETGIIESDSGLTAPLPTFGLTGGYAITDKWVARAGVGVFGFELALTDEEELGGEIIAAELAIQHRTFENVHFGLSFSYFDLSAEFKNSGRLTVVSYQYQGPRLSVMAVF